MNPQPYYANGKLLLTGEYLVMHGAKALAVPLQYGQSMTVINLPEKVLRWNARKPGGKWFDAVLSLPDLKVMRTSDREMSKRLTDAFAVLQSLKPEIFQGETGFKVVTRLDFEPEYGFGTSSTFIANLAAWAEADPYEIQRKTFGGSGYDIACAKATGPIQFQLISQKPLVTQTRFQPPFADQIYFVYLGSKRKSADAIKDFKDSGEYSPRDIDTINQLTERLIHTSKLDEFQFLIAEHEAIMSSILKLPDVKSKRFPDLKGAVKSLGAWGGDFVMLISEMDRDEITNYLKNKDYQVFFSFPELVL